MHEDDINELEHATRDQPKIEKWKSERIYIDYFMVGERVRFLFTSCEESQTNE